MRRFVVLMICLALAVSGLARAHAVEPPCPMAQLPTERSADDHAAHAAAMAMHDCCNAADAAAKTGKLCKVGQECAVGHAAGPTPDLHTPHDAAPPVIGAPARPFLLSFHPPGVWRPPALA